MICEELFKGPSPEAERVMQMVTAYAKRLKVQALFKPYNNPPYTQFPHQIELTDFFAQKTGTGAGTKIMQFLAKLADQYGLNVYCHPESGRNTEFYGRFGFVRSHHHHGMLVRYPPMPDEDDERDDDWEDWQAGQRAKIHETTRRDRVINDPNFRRWFANSKVVDSAGLPLEVYHGTKADFDTFTKQTAHHEYMPSDEAEFFFTSQPDLASDHAMKSGHEGYNVIPVYLRIVNPTSDYRQFLDGNGYDGFINDDGIFCVKNANQIKSAVSNTGAYSSADRMTEDTAFHGSNNDFQEFSVDHIGTGQGRATFGWGIYVTKHKPIARRYRKSGGKIYHVDIPDDSEFLSWELPLNQQPPRVQAALKKMNYEKIRQKMIDDEMVAGYQTGKTDTDTGENIYGIIVSALLSKPEPGNFFANYQADQKKASMRMLKAGIAGIKHLDPDTGSPRNGQYNYVIFDPRRIKIVKTTKT